MKNIFCLAVALALALSLKSQENAPRAVSTSKGLKDYYKDYFLMGVAVTPRSLHGPDSALIVREFNSLTAENAMKMGPIHPREDEFNWKDADSVAAFAKMHGLKMRGHTLCWHNQP